MTAPDARQQASRDILFMAHCQGYFRQHSLPASPAEEAAAIAECQRRTARDFPMFWYQMEGIEQGRQWHILGWLAARYARELGVTELADQLWTVMDASPQDRSRPWTRRHAADIAQRACRFIQRDDARQERELRESGWLSCPALAGQQARAQGRARPVRKPGARKAGAR